MRIFLLLVFTLLFHSTRAQIIISEIMADPTPVAGLPDAEFVEIFNLGTTPVNLSGWVFFDGSVRALPNKIIPPNTYGIVCAQADSSLFASYGLLLPVSSISLTNAGDKISIRNTTGFAVDSVTYTDQWYADPIKAQGGFSLERIDQQLNCLLPSNWKASNSINGGTPGMTNSVNGSLVDVEPPILLHAYCPDSTNIQLVFNEPVDMPSSNLSSYISLPNPMQVVAWSVADETATRINIKITPPVSRGSVFSLSINDIPDCSGNAIQQTENIPFGLSDSIQAGDIVINEILFNPKEDGFDFIELFNNSTRIADVTALGLASVSPVTGTIGDVKTICSLGRHLYPNEYLLITENTEVVSKQYPSSFPYDFQKSEDIPSMNVDEGMVSLLFGNTEIDRVYYHEDYHFALLTDPKGISLERIHPSRPSMNKDSWHSASPDLGGASPGLLNTQYQNQQPVESLISLSPEIFSPDMDGHDDLVNFQLKNDSPGTVFNVAILNQNGNLVYENRRNRLAGVTDFFSWDGINYKGELADPGIYVALFEIFNLAGEVKNEKLVFVLAKKY
ncbi:MAG: lamin tail domain-containing protein [Bacteroidota bacterium]